MVDVSGSEVESGQDAVGVGFVQEVVVVDAGCLDGFRVLQGEKTPWVQVVLDLDDEGPFGEHVVCFDQDVALSGLVVEDFIELGGDFDGASFSGYDLVDPAEGQVVAETRHGDGW